MHETRSTLYIITEMGFGGDLLDAISHRHAYSEDVARKMFANMLSAMAYVQTECLYSIQCSEIFTLRIEKLHTEA
jgi:hypothetical protein